MSKVYHCPTWVLSLPTFSLLLPIWALIPPYFRHWNVHQKVWRTSKLHRADLSHCLVVWVKPLIPHHLVTRHTQLSVMTARFFSCTLQITLPAAAEQEILITLPLAATRGSPFWLLVSGWNSCIYPALCRCI